MLEVHGRIAVERRNEVGDPIAPVAAALADEARLLAFDEMMVTNSPDAMILSRLFTALIEAGVTVVTTSNRAPGDLYLNGLNREHFCPSSSFWKHRWTCCRSTARSTTAATGWVRRTLGWSRTGRRRPRSSRPLSSA
jgi:predicted ATPase